ncbi:MAG: citrate transporter [Planctomycetota bacterium]
MHVEDPNIKVHADQNPAVAIAKVAAIGAAVGALVGGLAVAFGTKVGGIPIEYGLFVGTLLGITLAHHFSLHIAFGGLVATAVFKTIAIADFSFAHEVAHEWVILGDLLGLLVGFGLLADHFERSGVPERIPNYLPKGALGAFCLLVAVFVMSSFLDNIAAAMIGGGVASSVFKRRVHISYLAGIVVASNAGGAGSVIGDTTTTMMWLHGHSPLKMVPAFIGAIVTLVISGSIASWVQNRYAPLEQEGKNADPIDGKRLVAVASILVAAVVANVLRKGPLGPYEHMAPLLAIAIWLALGVTSILRRPTWSLVPGLTKASAFLLCLVLTAAFMPLDTLPKPSAGSSFVIGAVSAVFDNIPLTAIALSQDGYDWAILAFTVGVGGSMTWFGSSAGVALCARFPAGKSVANWVRQGWHVPVAYAAGFYVLHLAIGWNPDYEHHEGDAGSSHETGLTHNVEATEGVHVRTDEPGVGEASFEKPNHR